MAASCLVGVLIGTTTANFAIISQVSENKTQLVGLRRDMDRHEKSFSDEQRRTDERLAKQADTVREFMILLREQNVLLKQMMDGKNKP